MQLTAGLRLAVMGPSCIGCAVLEAVQRFASKVGTCCYIPSSAQVLTDAVKLAQASNLII